MRIQRLSTLYFAAIILLTALACSLPGVTASPPTQPPPPPIQPALPTIAPAAVENPMPTLPPPTATQEIVHLMVPAEGPSSGTLVYDVESSGTGPEKRAPYGDSYKINRLERPFLQDMTYIPDLDIATYTVSSDDNWYYVWIKLIGTNPNHEMGINYGVEIDNDADGFGDTIIWASPPYTPQWDVAGVRVMVDKNHDTGGRSASLSDAPLAGDGYETQIFDSGQGQDPDLAWVRTKAGLQSTLQIAFKKSLTDGAFMLGVLADAGLKDVTKLDYVDRFTIEEAGSPVRDNQNYPLKVLYAVDNACREAFGFKPSGYEPQLCPRAEPTPGSPSSGCQNPSQYTNQTSCEAAGCRWTRNPETVIAVVYYCTQP